MGDDDELQLCCTVGACSRSRAAECKIKWDEQSGHQFGFLVIRLVIF